MRSPSESLAGLKRRLRTPGSSARPAPPQGLAFSRVPSPESRVPSPESLINMPRTATRDVHGILLLDKPSGPSSNRALQQVRQLFGAARAGHTGSLDPLASGLLPICLGEATKIAGLLLGARKAYAAEVRLGLTTTTDDAEGDGLVERAVPALQLDAVRAT